MSWWKIFTTDEEIEREFNKYIKEHIQQLFRKFKKEIDQKTIIYIIWSIMGIILLNVSISKPVYYSGLSLMTIIFIYIVITSFQFLRKLISSINNFESYITETIKTKMQEIKEKSWVATIGVWLSRRNDKDFEDLAIASIVRELLQLMKNYKFILSICIRAFAYIVTLIVFKEVLIYIIKYTSLNAI